MGKKQQQAGSTSAPSATANLNSNASDRPAPVFKAPLKPRPVLFRVLLGAIALWMAALLALYFTTVYPHRGANVPAATAGDLRVEHPVPR